MEQGREHRGTRRGEALRRATAFGVIPVVEIDAVPDADALAESLLEAGLGVVEITFRTHAAAEVIARIAAPPAPASASPWPPASRHPCWTRPGRSASPTSPAS